MSKLKLKDLKIGFPVNFKKELSDAHIAEWLEYELGVSNTIDKSNPLSGLSIKDCNVTVGKAILDGVDVTID